MREDHTSPPTIPFTVDSFLQSELIEGAKLCRIGMDYDRENRASLKLPGNSPGRGIVTHGVRRDGFGNAGGSMRFPARQLDGVRPDVAARDSPWEEPRLGFGETPPVAEDVQQPGGEHDVAIFLSLAEFDAD